MNLTRLAVLGLLADHGAAHGHLLRRLVRERGADRWASIGDGAINRELRSCERDGLVRTVRREQVANRPERTVLAITRSGRARLRELTVEALSGLHPAVDPVAVALVFAGGSVSSALVARSLADRARRVVDEVDRLSVERVAGEEQGFLDPEGNPAEALAFRRAELHAAAEQAWQRECDRLLGAGAAPMDGGRRRR